MPSEHQSRCSPAVSGRTLYAGLVLRPKSWQCPHAVSTSPARMKAAPRPLLISTTCMDVVWQLPCEMEFRGERLWSRNRRTKICRRRYVRNFGFRTQVECMRSRAALPQRIQLRGFRALWAVAGTCVSRGTDEPQLKRGDCFFWASR